MNLNERVVDLDARIAARKAAVDRRLGVSGRTSPSASRSASPGAEGVEARGVQSPGRVPVVAPQAGASRQKSPRSVNVLWVAVASCVRFLWKCVMLLLSPGPYAKVVFVVLCLIFVATLTGLVRCLWAGLGWQYVKEWIVAMSVTVLVSGAFWYFHLSPGRRALRASDPASSTRAGFHDKAAKVIDDLDAGLDVFGAFTIPGVIVKIVFFLLCLSAVLSFLWGVGCLFRGWGYGFSLWVGDTLADAFLAWGLWWLCTHGKN